MPFRCRHLPVLAVCALTAAPLTTGAPAAGAVTSAGHRPAHPHQRLDPLLEPAARRLELADMVAAAKWGTGKPIEDPGRERQELKDIAGKSAAEGLDPGKATAVFRDQIEAAKLVERGLYARWRAHPWQRPTRRPDLVKEVRPRLDRVNDQLLYALGLTRTVRTRPYCPAQLALESGRVAAAHRFGPLHGAGFARAVSSLCR